MLCTNCWKETPDNCTICVYCGHNLFEHKDAVLPSDSYSQTDAYVIKKSFNDDFLIPEQEELRSQDKTPEDVDSEDVLTTASGNNECNPEDESKTAETEKTDTPFTHTSKNVKESVPGKEKKKFDWMLLILAVISLAHPVAGLIVYIIERDKNHLYAKTCGICAIISAIVYAIVIISILFVFAAIIGSVVGVTVPTPEYYDPMMYYHI